MKMKQGKLFNLICGMLWLLQFVAEGFVFATILRLDMLPAQYNMVLIGALLLLWAMTGLLLFMRGGKKGGGMLRRGIACVMILLIVVGCAAVVTVVTDVYQRLHAVVEQPVDDGITRTVYVRMDDPAQTLADAKDYTFARIEDYDEDYILQAIEVIEDTVGQPIQVRTYAAVREMVDALYAGDIDAIIIDSANIDMLEEDEAYLDIHQKIRALYEVPLKKTAPPVETDPNGAVIDTQPMETVETVVTLPVIEKPEDITNTPFVMYIAGSDTRSSKLTTGRNDVNILAVVNPETKQILLLNTPRDYYVANPAGNGRMDKLTHCGNAGVENSIKALENLYGIRIDYYARINFKGFKTMIDAVGGITVYSDKSFTTIDGHRIQKGENFLDGEKALSFARERYAVSGGDSARGENQMKIIKALIQKLTSATTIISKYADILDSLNGMFATNISMDEISQLVKMQLDDMASWNIVSYAVSGTGGMDITYSDPGHELYVCYPDETTVAKAQELIRMVAEGEIITDADVG